MKTKRFAWQWPVTASAVVLAATLGAFFAARPKAAPKIGHPPTPAEAAALERSKLDAKFDAPEAKSDYEAYVDKYKSSPDRQIQDQVGAARIRLAYVTAKEASVPARSGTPARIHDATNLTAPRGGEPQGEAAEKIEQARQIFLEAAKDYKGTGTMASDFGGIKDQALYEAAACLNAEGRKSEYRAALVGFIKTQPLSPLVDAAYKRIVKLDGKSNPALDALLQTAHDKQEKKIRFETSVCGPKCIVKLLELLAAEKGKDTGQVAPAHSEMRGPADYEAIAKLCGTTDKGTTMEGLRKGLKAFNLDYYGYTVSRADLPNVRTPAILYVQDHYLVVERVRGQVLTVFDPMFTQERTIDYSKVPDDQYSVAMLLGSPPGQAGR